MVWLFSAAIVAGVYRSISLFAVVLVCMLTRAVVLRATQAWIAVVLAGVCAFIGWGATARADADRRVVAEVADRARDRPVVLRGWVDEFPQSGPYGSTFVLATQLEGRPLRLSIRSHTFDVAYGDSLQVDARLATNARVPSAFLTARGVAGEARARFEDVRRIGRVRGCPLMREVFWPMHRAARTRLVRALGGEAALPVGLLLGERGTLDRRAYDAVRALGITHLLALSGMHLTMIAALAVFATHWTPRRRDAAVALALSLYVGMVGNVDSLTRAYVMALLILAARALVRPPKPIDALGKALWLMLLCAPQAILSVGLQLSFAATLAVLWCLGHLPAQLLRSPAASLPAWRRVVVRCVQGGTMAFLVSLAVEVFIAPLQLHHFGRASVVGPLATVVFAFPVTLLQGLALAASIGWPAPVSDALAMSLAWASSATRDAIVGVGSFAPKPVAIPEPQCIVYYAAVLVVCARPRRAWAWCVAATGIALAFIVGGP